MLDPIELSWHRVRARCPNTAAKSNFYHTPAPRDKHDRKIFAIFEIPVCTLGWDVSRLFAALPLRDPRIISCPLSYIYLFANAIYRTFMIGITKTELHSEHSRCLLARSSGFFNFTLHVSLKLKHVIFPPSPQL